MGFQAVIKSAASAASLGTKKSRKHAQNTQNMRKTRQNHKNPGLSQKLKVPKWVCRSTLANFCNGPPFFAIFGPARGQIYGKIAEKILKNAGFSPFLGLVTLVLWSYSGYSGDAEAVDEIQGMSRCILL